MCISPRSGEPQDLTGYNLGVPSGKRISGQVLSRIRVTIAKQVESGAFPGKPGWELEVLQPTAEHKFA